MTTPTSDTASLPGTGDPTPDEAVIRTVGLTKEFSGIPSGLPSGPPQGQGGPPGATGPRRPGGGPAPGPRAVSRPKGDGNGQAKPFRAVDRLDLRVRRGEIFGLLGPNGAGKTTTIGMLTTRVVPTSGEAYVDGQDVVSHPAATKQLIGVVTQTNTLDRSLSVHENLYYHGRYFGMGHREARTEAERLLEQFRLAERGDTEVASLSGGMAQRLMVARAIMHRPRVLFLDEPTTGLDPQSRIALWEIIRDLNEAGQTILLTTHYMEEADQLCDRVAIMDHGRILMLDTPEGLKRSVDADSIVTLHADGDLDELVRVLRDDIDGVTAAHVDDEQDPPVVRVLRHGQDTAIGPIVAAAERCACTLHDLSISETTLETVFIALTGKDLRE